MRIPGTPYPRYYRLTNCDYEIVSEFARPMLMIDNSMKPSSSFSTEDELIEAGAVVVSSPSHVGTGKALKDMLFMLEGTSGMGASYWGEFPQYAQAVRALHAEGWLTKDEADSRLEVVDMVSDDE
jgi:hypothetical protein